MTFSVQNSALAAAIFQRGNGSKRALKDSRFEFLQTSMLLRVIRKGMRSHQAYNLGKSDCLDLLMTWLNLSFFLGSLLDE